MSILNQLFETLGFQKAQSAQEAVPENMIEVFDGYGRKMMITKEKWRKDVLPDKSRISG